MKTIFSSLLFTCAYEFFFWVSGKEKRGIKDEEAEKLDSSASAARSLARCGSLVSRDNDLPCPEGRSWTRWVMHLIDFFQGSGCFCRCCCCCSFVLSSLKLLLLVFIPWVFCFCCNFAPSFDLHEVHMRVHTHIPRQTRTQTRSIDVYTATRTCICMHTPSYICKHIFWNLVYSCWYKSMLYVGVGGEREMDFL